MNEAWRRLRNWVLIPALAVYAAGWALNLSPAFQRVEAQVCTFNAGYTLTGNAACQFVGQVFGAGLQVGLGGTPMSLIEEVDLSVTSTQIASGAEYTVTGTVPNLVSNTFSGNGTPLTPTRPIGICAYKNYTTATSGGPAGTFLANPDFLTPTSAVTGTAAPGLTIKVRIVNASGASVASAGGTVACLVIAM